MKYIIDYIVVFFNWIIDLFESIFQLLFNLIMVLVKALQFLTSVIGHLPLFIIAPAGVLVIVCVLYKILGREGGEAN